MEIKFTEDMKREIVSQATTQLLRTVIAEFNVKQIAAEVKNAVVKEAAKDLSRRFGEAYKTSEVVERAVQSAESRVQDRVTKMLEKGVTISFKDIA